MESDPTSERPSANRSWVQSESKKDWMSAKHFEQVAETAYRTLFHSISQGFCIIEVLFDDEENPEDYRFLEVNSAFERQTGLSDPVGKRMRQLRPDHEEYWFQIFGEVAKTREQKQFEMEASALGRWYSVDAFPVGSPEKHRVGVLFSDVADRVEAEAQLAESERQFRVAAENLMDPLTIYSSIRDSHGKITDFRVEYCNEVACRQMGMDRSDYVGQTVRTLYPNLRHTEMFDLCVRAAEQREEIVRRRFPIDTGVQGLPGVHLFDFRLAPLDDGFTSSWRNVTRQVEREQALYRAKEAAEKANQAKTDFMGTVTHELRTPLNAIVGYADLMLAGIPEPLPPELRDPVQRIEQASNHLLQIIEEILSFSRLEAGRANYEESDCSIDDLVGEIRAIMEPLAEEKGLKFEVDTTEASPRFQTDQRKLRQILINLLGNALKFTDEGTVSLRIRDRDDNILFVVSDTGQGILTQELEHLFEPFWQGQGSKSGGTGIGLTVSKQYADLLSGELSVWSEVGEGSRFQLQLPRRI